MSFNVAPRNTFMTKPKRDLRTAQPNNAACPCPCGGGDYRSCCEPLHLGAIAETPEALMRSRYSAYVKNLERYLRSSWHPSTCPVELQLDPDCVWLGLEVKSAYVSGDQITGTVEFVARYRIKGASAMRMTERSEFVRFEGRWVYLLPWISPEALDTVP